jgi:uncharacterized alpha-E superfamily protein
MLSRTADYLYWMARAIERAENNARVLDVTNNMSLIQNTTDSEVALWRQALQISGNVEMYLNNYGDYSAANIIQYLAMDMNNPSSIYSALRSARENARAVRVALTSETWESINTLWLEFDQFKGQDLSNGGLHEFCDWVKSRSHLFRGVCFGTMLRDDAFRFLRLGTFIERADNTARLLDVKYEELLPTQEDAGAGVDYYEWSAVLRSVSAFQAYQKIFSDAIEPSRVAELFILRRDMPRSLHACYDEILPILEQLSGERVIEATRIAGELHAKLRYGKMAHIFQHGMHAFLTEFIRTNNQLGNEIQRTFLNASVS